jgi:hypothetical protein
MARIKRFPQEANKKAMGSRDLDSGSYHRKPLDALGAGFVTEHLGAAPYDRASSRLWVIEITEAWPDLSSFASETSQVERGGTMGIHWG